MRRLEKSDGDMGALGRLTLGTPGGRSSAHPCTSKAWAIEIPRCRSPRTCSPSRCDTRDVGSRAPRWSWSAFFSLDQTGGSACGCVLIAPFGSCFCAVSRVGVTPWVNRGGLYPSCVRASTVPETSGVSSPPFDTEIKGEERRRDIISQRRQKIPRRQKSSLAPFSAVSAIRPFSGLDTIWLLPLVELTSPSAVPLRATARVNFELMTQLQLNIVGDSAATARLEVSVRPLRVISFPGILMPNLYMDI